MFNKSILHVTLLFLVSCSSFTIQDEIVSGEGWIDDDTYMVTATGANERQAVDNARHQILKDIVEVRVRNKSRYTDIIIIREEFEAPLQNGEIVDRRAASEGIRIIFQIREKDLRKKFMRQ
jgi:hypothetical protein